MSENKTTSTGVSLTGLLFLAFLVLKLTKVITWSWWWVTAPLWAPIALLLVGLFVFLLIWLVSKTK